MQIESKLPDFVSIVMTYHDRLGQLKKTLDSFQKHRYTDFEVIIVDDGSEKEPVSDDLFRNYDFPVVVINMPVVKTYVNPSVPYNVGFSRAKGNIVVIQNSECLHLDNVLDHARKNIKDSNYITYGCFSLSRKHTEEFIQKENWEFDGIREIISTDTLQGMKGLWKNHSLYRPQALHFTSVIKKENLDKLEGFDKRYANGTSFDDEEILDRIKRIPLSVEIEDNILTVHQWHGDTVAGINKPTSKYRLHTLHLRNQLLYKYVTNFEKGYKNNVNSFYYILYKLYSPVIIFLIASFKAIFAGLKKQ